MTKIGILGGSFNPVHNGHIHLARCFYERLGLDRVLLIPVSLPPHKDSRDIADPALRLGMCQAACEGRPWLAPCDVELRRGGKSYTVDTLEDLHRRFPDAELYLLMGTDMFLTLESWNRFEKIARLAFLCCARRSDDGQQKLEECAHRLALRYKARCFVEDIPALELSSTQVRERIAAGEDISGLVPEGVRRLIEQKGLYKNG